MPDHPTDSAAVDTAAAALIDRWRGVSASELSTAQSFVISLCDWLGVPAPHATPEQNYLFERPVTFLHGNGSRSAGRIDCYKRGHFVLEAKKLKVDLHSRRFDDGLLRARSQAENYARALPAAEGRPPFVLVVDVGTVIEVYAEFSRSGGTYTPFPDPRSHRILLADLARPEIRQRLHLIWTDPERLNPTRISAEVTRDVAALLAALATSLENDPARPSAKSSPPTAQPPKNITNQPVAPVNIAQAATQDVASFLTRCLFSMFAEDVELLPKGAFLGLLKTHRDDPATLQQMLRMLWADMDQGGFSAALAKPVLHFNGKLFKQPNADGYSLLLNKKQIDLLIQAAQANWREVEPAIFGTLLERALNPVERHALGAHYTPRAYVERLVWPTVIEPLRADWANAQAAALVLAREAATLDGRAQAAKRMEARAEVKKFHHHLCNIRVLDPACGSGNFLYVTLEHLKRLEGEVINQLEALGQTQEHLGFEGETVTLQQLRGIEINPRAAALAELVLWIGWLQWHIRARGLGSVATPVIHDYGNIECRDAVLACDAQEPAVNAAGQWLTRWDGVSFKTHPATGEPVPDEAAQIPQWTYVNPRQAQWPSADFVVGNPPFIGASSLRAALGDGYAEGLRRAWHDMPESADFVMFWWAQSAALVACGRVRRFGLITTNSVRQTLNRRVVQAALNGQTVALPLPSDRPNQASASTIAEPPKPLALRFAIADHPWVDAANGAAVRIAMTVVGRGAGDGILATVTTEQTGTYGEVDVSLVQRSGLIHADLRIGANVAAAVALQANAGLTFRGVTLMGSGFWVDPAHPLVTTEPGSLKPLRNGRDLTDRSRGMFAIDFFGLTQAQARLRFPMAYQRVLNQVKPEREQSQREAYRQKWWLFAEARPDMRQALKGLSRYIATPMTAKHRVFQMLADHVLPDQGLIILASDAMFDLGVVSSRVHVTWALAQGGTLEDRPRYNNSRCFETFPFPDEDTGLTPALRDTIASRAEQIDAHRKRQQAAHPALTLTGLYNVLDKLRRNQPLSPPEKVLHEDGLVSLLQTLHDELDAAVLQAYGWADLGPPPWADSAGLHTWTQALLTRLAALNAQRTAQEQQGQIRWLRPAFQDPVQRQQQAELLLNQELLAQTQRGLQADLAYKTSENTTLAPDNPDDLQTPHSGTSDSISSAITRPHGQVFTATPAQPWPATLPDQVRAVAQQLASACGPLTLAQIEAAFKGRGNWKKALPALLETLVALGRAQRFEAGDAATWGTV